MDSPGEITQPPDLMDMYRNDCLRPIMRKWNYISVVEELTYLWDHVKEMHDEARKSAPEDAELELWMWLMSFEDIFYTLKAQAHCADTFMTMPKFASSVQSKIQELNGELVETMRIQLRQFYEDMRRAIMEGARGELKRIVAKYKSK
eukprot:m51a1_g11483 hypothetical protein (147) ;mRNA; f:10485-10925